MFNRLGRQSAPRLNVVVVTPTGEGGRGGIDRMMDGVRNEVREHPRADVDLRFLISRGGSIYFSPIVLMLALLKILYLRARHSADVIHINLSANASAYRKIAVAALASALRIPYVVHLHSGEFGLFWDSCNRYTRRWIDRLFANADSVIVLGRVWSDLISKRVPEAANRIVVMPNSTKQQNHNVRGNGPVKILFLGRLGPAKGIGELLDAFQTIRHRDDWQATLAGDGTVAETRALVERLGLTERVRVPGWLDDSAVTSELQTSDILVLPSWIENLPMCVVEAFAHGLTVVCTPVGALPEIVEHERTGLLVPVKSASALASALERLLADPALRIRLGAQARAEHTFRFEIGAYVDKLVGVWSKAAHRTRDGGEASRRSPMAAPLRAPPN